MLNERGLANDAFRPKVYVVRIEKGNFKVPAFIGESGTWAPRCELRLLFDISPYPPEHEWKNPEANGDVLHRQFWNIKEFVGRKLPETAKKVRAINVDASGWDSCIVS